VPSSEPHPKREQLEGLRLFYQAASTRSLSRSLIARATANMAHIRQSRPRLSGKTTSTLQVVPVRALPTETKVESGTSQRKSGTSVNLSKSGFRLADQAASTRSLSRSLIARPAANMAHIRQSRPDSGLGIQLKQQGAPVSLGRPSFFLLYYSQT